MRITHIFPIFSSAAGMKLFPKWLSSWSCSRVDAVAPSAAATGTVVLPDDYERLIAYVREYPFVVGECDSDAAASALATDPASRCIARTLHAAEVTFPPDMPDLAEVGDQYLAELMETSFAIGRWCAWDAYTRYHGKLHAPPEIAPHVSGRLARIPEAVEDHDDGTDGDAEEVSARGQAIQAHPAIGQAALFDMTVPSNLEEWARYVSTTIRPSDLFVTNSETTLHLQVLVGRERAAQLRLDRGLAIPMGSGRCIPSVSIARRPMRAPETGVADITAEEVAAHAKSELEGILTARLAKRGPFSPSRGRDYCSCSRADMIYLFGIGAVQQPGLGMMQNACPAASPINAREDNGTHR